MSGENNGNGGMLTTMCWVPLGAMRAVPMKAAQEAEEAKEAIRKRFGEDGAPEEEEAQALDSDDDNNDDAVFGHGAGNIVDQVESDDESELDDITYKETDLVFVSARASEDPHFEVYVYDEPADNMYVHHDVAITAFPLCSTWMTDGSTSLYAVGTMHPYVEIWSLDVMDPVDPVLVLGGCEQVERNYKRKIRKEWLKPESHQDAVSAMQWNRQATNILATGSADKTLKIWDLQQGVCLGTYKEADRVQSTEWHSVEANLLLSACGNEFSIRDCRTPDAPAARWSINRDTIESVRWDYHSGLVFASTGNGKIAAYEAKMGGQQIWSVKAHDAETVIDISPHAPILAAGGKDGAISLWDIRGTPTAPICSRKLRTGQVFQTQFHPNLPHILGAVGSQGLPLVYTITADVKPLGLLQ